MRINIKSYQCLYQKCGRILLFWFVMFLFDLRITHAQVTLQAITSINLPNTPQELARGDFNNDGLIDFASINFGAVTNQSVTIMLNTGTGTFTGTNVRNFSSASNPVDIAIGDFNKDGKLDVVTCSQPNNNFSLLLGDGAGNLAAPTDFTAGDVPEGIAVGDFNKDNNPDVIVSCRGTPSQVFIFLGNGAGNFAAPTVMTISGTTDVVVADFNKDTNPDFALSIASPGSVQLYTGNGSGTAFSAGTVVTGFAVGEDLIAADLDNDSDMDILAGGGYTLGDGAGNFGARILISNTNYEYSVGDINKDGKPDIIASDNNVNYTNMRVFLGDGAGVFTFLAKFESNILFRGVEIADVNNDSNPDVVGVGSWGAINRADIFLGSGTGYFNGVTKYPVASDPREMVKGDFNEDSILDIAICFSAGNNVSIYLGSGQGKFSKTATNYTTGAYPSEILVVDYNKDGHQDLITNNRSGASVTVLNGIGNGNFNSQGNLNLPTNTEGITSADFNKDTNLDIAAAGNTANAVYLLAGTGTGFSAAATIPTTANVFNVKAADFNGDGNPDLAASFTNTSRFLILSGNGAGSFTEGTQYIAPGASFIRIYDLNNDNKPDALVRTSGEHHFINDGTGNFTTNTFSAGNLLGSDYADMDGDGIKDLVYGSQNSISSETGLIRIYKGSGTGTFNTTTPLLSKQSSGGNKLFTYDFNGDDKMDILTTSFNIYEDYFSILINTTGPPPCNAPSITFLSGSASICEGSNRTLSVTATGDAPLSYQWRKNASDISGATTSSYTITSATAADAANYSVRITNSCGTLTSSAITLSVNTTPAAPGTTGASSCVPASLQLNASGGSNGDYRWYDNLIDPTPLPGEVNSTYTTPLLSATKIYYVSLINASGCQSTKTPASAIIGQPGKPSIASSTPISGGIAQICQGQNITLNAPAGFASYIWSNGEITQQISTNQEGTFTVTVGNGGCSSPPSDPVTIIISPAPMANITINGNLLNASSGNSWQWYQNGNPISGATTQNLEISLIEYGVYAVDVSTSAGCIARSPNFEYLITHTDMSTGNCLLVSPNPFYAQLHIVSLENTGHEKYEFRNNLGQQIFLITPDQKITTVNTEQLSEGVYYLKIKTDKTEKTYRLLKIK